MKQEANILNATVFQSSRTISPNAFEEITSLWKNQHYTDVAIDYSSFGEQNPAIAAVLHSSPCITWILDLRSLQFDFITSNTQTLLAYDPVLFTCQGLCFLNQITHPADALKTWSLVKRIWDLLIALPAEKRKHHKFNHDYRVARADGRYVRILEQCSILQQDSSGNITHIMGICSDITQLKKTDLLSASLFSTEGNASVLLEPEPEFQEPKEKLSKRELEIIRLIAAGYSSKLIADKLCIEFSTVNTHRQNIIRKTNTRNTGEFVQYAIGKNLI